MRGAAPVLRVRIVKDDCSPLWALRCADACSSCRLTFSAEPAVCWLASSMSQRGAVRIALERNWQVVK